MAKFYMIGNTHFDPVWLWRWDEAMASIRATFRSALDRMKEDSGFVYSFVTPPVFEWIKDTDPQMFEEIKLRIQEGRWDLAEGWWLQPDCYSANGESYVRQGLYAQKYLKENFGRYSNVVFNIDSFGHSPMLPQILAKCGIRYYCFVRPEKYHVALQDPYFKWQSPDGSSVYAYRAEDAYSKKLSETADTLGELYPGNVLIVYGVTDHGGAPTKRDLALINSREDMQFSTVEGFFQAQGDTDYCICGELVTGDFGPYANGVDIKIRNMQAELAALNAEKVAVIAGKPDTKLLADCWKDILFNQFHDILGGACIRQAYYDANNLHGRAITNAEYAMHTNLQRVTRQIQMPGKNPDNPWNLVVWNLNTTPYDGCIEAEVQWLHEFDAYEGGIELEDAEGNRYACQLIRELSVIPGFRTRFVFKARIPALGYKSFKVIQNHKEDVLVRNPRLDPYVLETKRFRFAISKEDGSISEIYNKETGAVQYVNLLQPVCYEDTGDTWAFNIEKYGAALGSFRLLKAEVVENGLHRTKIKLTSAYRESKLVVHYTFYEDACYFDMAYRVNWNEKFTAFKLNLPKAPGAVRVGVPGGEALRAPCPGDVPMNRWMQVGDLRLVSGSLFAYSAEEDTLGLTVLRSPIYGDLRLRDIDLEADYAITQQGLTEGALRILFCGDPVQEAELFCNPCFVIDESNHDGTLPSTGSYLDLQTEGVSVMALKHCEEGEGVILRLREYLGKGKQVSLTFAGKAYETAIAAHEIKTVKLLEGQLTEVDMLEDPL